MVVSGEPFAAIVGAEHVRTDAEFCRYFSRDIFFWDDATTAAAVVAPADAQQVSAVLTAAAAQNLRIAIRGGGMSYTGGYVPTRPDTVLLDLRRLNRVRELNVTDQYLTVEAGATWESVSAALVDTGLQPSLKGPYSGNVSTVGGALSQGVVDEMTGVLSLEVALPDGLLVRTGSAARQDHPSPFFRNFGPDLTGLFIGDGGTLGVKTAATLALEPVPAAKQHASFAFESFASITRAMIGCARLKLPSRIMGLDPKKSQNAPRVGFKSAIETVAKVALTSNKLRGGLRDAFAMAAAGRNFMEGVKWSLHITADGTSEVAAEAAIGAFREVCLTEGREIPNLLPIALGARPFSVRGFLGPDGERWVPTNAVLAPSSAKAAAQQVLQFFERNRARMQAHGIWESYMLGARPGFVLIEPSFYWRDEVSALHLDHLDAATAARFTDRAPDPAARRCVMELRQELIQLFESLGAAHVQLARAYRFDARLDPATQQLWRTLRAALDPEGRISSDNLRRLTQSGDRT
ncbi:MAG: FAD-binding oxidoreductase [Steroidobacteraceae bacterium]|nr:FAD-binding oxidoreductase [Steroidobacteraceae bacterium]